MYQVYQVIHVTIPANGQLVRIIQLNSYVHSESLWFEWHTHTKTSVLISKEN